MVVERRRCHCLYSPTTKIDSDCVASTRGIETRTGSGSAPVLHRMDVEDTDINSGRGDALHLDMGRAAYEEDVSGIRASKRGRSS